MPEEPQNPLEVWDARVKQLSSAVRLYESSSHDMKQLYNALSPETSSTDGATSPLERALGLFDQKLVDLAALEETLHSTRLAFQVLRNRSLRLIPINRLPNEVLAHIFVLGVKAEEEARLRAEEEDDADELDDEVTAEKDDSPFLKAVTLVCRHWRDLALRTGALWTYINFTSDRPITIAKVQTRLERSRHSLLDVNVDFNAVSLNEDIPEEVDAILRAHAHRCASLSIFSRKISDLPRVLSCFADSELPLSLKSLSLIDLDGDGSPRTTSGAAEGPLNVALHAIRRLCLHGVGLPSWSSPAFTNLIYLKLALILDPFYQPTIAQFMAVLHSSPHLDTLFLEKFGLRSGAVHDKTHNGSNGPCNPFLSVSNLRVLKLHKMVSTKIEMILSRISTPKLDIISVVRGNNFKPDDVEDDGEGAIEHWNDDIVFKQLCELLEREHAGFPPCKPTQLSLGEFLWDIADPITSLFQRLPNLEKLRFIECTVDGVLGAMSFDAHDPQANPLPHLRTLIIQDPEEVNDPDLASMLGSRFNAQRPLNLLHCSAPPEPEVREAVEGFVGKVVWT